MVPSSLESFLEAAEESASKSRMSLVASGWSPRLPASTQLPHLRHLAASLFKAKKTQPFPPVESLSHCEFVSLGGTQLPLWAHLLGEAHPAV